MRLWLTSAILAIAMNALAQSPIYQHNDVGGVFDAPTAGVKPDGIIDEEVDPENAAAVKASPKKVDERMTQQAAATEREFQNLYNEVSFPKISTGIAQNFTIINASATRLNVSTASIAYILGTTTNDSACATCYGAYLSSGGAIVSFGTSGQARDYGTLTLTPGDWDVTILMDAVWISGVVTDIRACIGTTPGNSYAGCSEGLNFSLNTGVTASDVSQTVSIPNYRISLSATTTFYHKYGAIYTVGAPVAVGRMSARRVR